MSVEWNTKGALWQQALVEAIREKLEDCVNGINGSGLPYAIDGGVVNHFGFKFTNRGIAFKLVEINRERSSDYDKEQDQFLFVLTATISIRFYYSDIADNEKEQEYQTAVVNMISNYLNDIKILETQTIDIDGTIIPAATWHSFATGREVADVAWYNGGFGSQIDLTCQTQIKQ